MHLKSPCCDTPRIPRSPPCSPAFVSPYSPPIPSVTVSRDCPRTLPPPLPVPCPPDCPAFVVPSAPMDTHLLSNIQKLFSERIDIFSPVEFNKVRP